MLGDGSFVPELYTLIDEEGNECTFEALDTLEYNDVTYFAMIPYFENPEEGLESDAQLIIMKTENVDGEELFAPVDDESELEKIFGIFIERLETMFDIEEDECGCGCCHHDHDDDHDCDCGCCDHDDADACGCDCGCCE